MTSRALLIYRIETEEGVGMYRHGKTAMVYLHDSERHPCPWDDAALTDWIGNIDIYKFHFGFKSKEQLKSWVYKLPWRLKLKEEGLIVGVYRVGVDAKEGVHYKLGDTQAMFQRSMFVREYIGDLITI